MLKVEQLVCIGECGRGAGCNVTNLAPRIRGIGNSGISLKSLRLVDAVSFDECLPFLFSELNCDFIAEPRGYIHAGVIEQCLRRCGHCINLFRIDSDFRQYRCSGFDPCAFFADPTGIGATLIDEFLVRVCSNAHHRSQPPHGRSNSGNSVNGRRHLFRYQEPARRVVKS